MPERELLAIETEGEDEFALDASDAKDKKGVVSIKHKRASNNPRLEPHDNSGILRNHSAAEQSLCRFEKNEKKRNSPERRNRAKEMATIEEVGADEGSMREEEQKDRPKK